MTQDIPIYDVHPRVQYTADGGERLFVYPFPVLEDSHLVVARGEQVLTLDADYTVSGVGNPRGGEVRLTDRATPGQVFTLTRRIPLERLADFQKAGALMPIRPGTKPVKNPKQPEPQGGG